MKMKVDVYLIMKTYLQRPSYFRNDVSGMRINLGRINFGMETKDVGWGN
jgi:hypothetical protein